MYNNNKNNSEIDTSNNEKTTKKLNKLVKFITTY